jgi:hypothetical protein
MPAFDDTYDEPFNEYRTGKQEFHALMVDAEYTNRK